MKDDMKTPAAKTDEKVEKLTKGRAAFIHKLRDGGAKKPDALAQTQEKFHCAESLFERIWKRKAQASAKAEKVKPAPAPKAARAAKMPKTPKSPEKVQTGAA